ncbi:hypothetical protein L3X38_021151 [Prunus dulcis]|uniref:Uncharacterized protein n=1 Tax=Prunus dulcis TaxID=3755 RepID=A0AAD4VR23_PRUDU|nr:hypothetical protein L3X38_029157 [Prunus dulcis]KAI5331025.1 hypothetical protein L3X38_021151 [Prunus dulcis]
MEEQCSLLDMRWRPLRLASIFLACEYLHPLSSGWTSRYFHPHIGLHLYILHSQTAVERFAHEDKGDFATSLKHFRVKTSTEE